MAACLGHAADRQMIADSTPAGPCPMQKALAGDRMAARQCVDRYVHEPKPRRYWMQIGAENGDVVSQYNFAMLLLSEGNTLERRRAVYWLEKAAAQGDAYAPEALREVRENPDAIFPLSPPERP
jgi:hypothetical protein